MSARSEAFDSAEHFAVVSADYMDARDVVRRLALIRYSLRQAVLQAGRPHPIGSLAILPLQDVVEWFLLLICEKAGIAVKDRAGFHDYLSHLHAARKVNELSYEPTLRRLNRARVALKHHGLLTAVDELQAFVYATREFVVHETQDTLGLNFDSVSLVDLISTPLLRNRLHEAMWRLENHQYGLAVDLSQMAMDYLQRSHQPYKDLDLPFPLRTPRYLMSHWEHPFSHGLFADRELRKFASDTSAAIKLLAEQTEALAMGFDWAEYARFSSYGGVSMVGDGSLFVYGSDSDDALEGAQFCIDFVTDAALRLTESSPIAADDNWQPPTVLKSTTLHHKGAGETKTAELEALACADRYEFREMRKGRMTRVQDFGSAGEAEDYRKKTVDQMVEHDGWLLADEKTGTEL